MSSSSLSSLFLLLWLMGMMGFSLTVSAAPTKCLSSVLNTKHCDTGEVGCVSSSSNSECYTCDIHYYPKSNKNANNADNYDPSIYGVTCVGECSNVIEGCLECQANMFSTSCMKCNVNVNPPYYYDVQTDTCSRCKVGQHYFYQSNPGDAEDTVVEVDTSIPIGCASCSGNGGTCNKCQDGYYLKLDEATQLHVCARCPTGCASCTSYDNCQTCIVNNNNNNNNNGGVNNNHKDAKAVIVVPQTTPAVDGKCTCRQTIPDCRSCSTDDPTQCSECKKGFGLPYCISCGSNKLTGVKGCMTCEKNYENLEEECSSCKSESAAVRDSRGVVVFCRDGAAGPIPSFLIKKNLGVLCLASLLLWLLFSF